MSSFGPDKVVLPTGTDANRPASPSNGFMRYNSDRQGVEMYTAGGWVIGGGLPGSFGNPASSGPEIYNSGQTSSGIYWFAGSTYGAGDNQFQMYVKNDYGGGWINLNLTAGPYSTILTSGFGNGGSDILAGASNVETSALACSNSTHAQATIYGCPGEPYKSYVDLNSTFASDFSISQVRMKILYVTDDSNVTCGPYWTSVLSSGLTIISGTGTQVGTTCDNPPNRYSDKNDIGFTVEFYGTLSSTTRLVQAWTACGGSYTMQLQELYVR